MKKIIIITASVLALMCSCSKGDPATVGTTPPAGGEEAVFSVDGIEAVGAETRSAHNYSIGDYFTLGAEFDRVQVEYGGSHIYQLDPAENIFEGISPADIIRFPQDGSPLTEVTMQWPVDAKTTAAGSAVVRDQSQKVDFMRMDRLSGTIRNVMPTTIISITMGHARSKITFTLGGEHEGKRIEELTVGDFKAYCDPALDDAQLIYDQTGDAGTLVNGTRGEVKVAGVAETLRFVLQSSPDTALAGKPGNYTVTLSF
jgi:hypothetical protein